MKSTDLLVLNHLFIFIVVVQPMQLRLKPFIVEQGGLVEFADKVLICLCLCMLKKNKMLASAPSDHNRFVTLHAPVLIPLGFYFMFLSQVDKTYDRPEDADLWKDGFFTRRVMRYMCVERQIPTQVRFFLQTSRHKYLAL